MQIRVGYELLYTFPQPTPMILTLNVHYTRANDLVIKGSIVTLQQVGVLGAGIGTATQGRHYLGGAASRGECPGLVTDRATSRRSVEIQTVERFLTDGTSCDSISWNRSSVARGQVLPKCCKNEQFS